MNCVTQPHRPARPMVGVVRRRQRARDPVTLIVGHDQQDVGGAPRRNDGGRPRRASTARRRGRSSRQISTADWHNCRRSSSSRRASLACRWSAAGRMLRGCLLCAKRTDDDHGKKGISSYGLSSCQIFGRTFDVKTQAERFTGPCFSCLGPFAGAAFPPQLSGGPA